MGKRIGVAEFRTHCLRILDEIESSGEAVTVTKRGRPIAEIKRSRNPNGVRSSVQ